MKHLAVANNRELQSLYAKWNAAENKAPQAAALPDPKLNYGYFLEPVRTKTGPQDQKIGISQTIPWFGKLSLKEKMAVKEAEAAFSEYENAGQRVIKDLEKTYYEYCWVYDALRINKEHSALLRLMESVAKVRFRNGKLSQSALVQIQMEQSRIEDRIRELEELKFPLSSAICSALGKETTKIMPEPVVTAAAEKLPDASVMKQRLVSTNPAIEKLRRMKQRAEFSLKLADKQYYPDFTFGMSYIDTDEGDDPALALVSINLPIWRKSLNANRLEAAKELESVDKRIDDMRLKLLSELDRQLYHYRNSLRKKTLYENTLVPKAQQAIDLLMKEFETGSVAIAELLIAERTLLEFQLEAARYIANAYQRKAEIQSLVTGFSTSVKQNGKIR
ncbi:MAG: TolC family protein [Kiritimatiellia bacterium]